MVQSIKPIPWHRASYRHGLIDMQIPDWDPQFLSRFDARKVADAVAAAGIGAIMTYFQSHTGLCNWPTRSGRQHAAFVGQNPMPELIERLHDHHIPVCGYYSVNFNNWAWETHPEWRIVPMAQAPLGAGSLQPERYGLCCLNHPEHRAFIRTQTHEIVSAHDVQAMFFDMVWWPAVCLCDACQQRYHDEEKTKIPTRINWFDADWCRFQATRERWLSEYAAELRNNVRRIKPDLAVYHNFAVAMMNWTKGISFESARAHDFLGGDFYGGPEEQLVVSKLMLNLSEDRPVEFMTTIAEGLAEHEHLHDVDQLRMKTLAAISCAASFLMIGAINPDGTMQSEAFRRMGEVFDETQKYDAELGGQPVEEIAVYYSSESKMRFGENGQDLLPTLPFSAGQYPHLDAVKGACRSLQQHHLPFGVITRKQLHQLSQYSVIVLPNVLRMDAQEVAAIREYVRNGGCLYASRETALTETKGVRHDDFMLADVFGCHFSNEENGRVIHLDLQDTDLAQSTGSPTMLSHWCRPDESTGAIRLRHDHEGKALARLNLPFGYPETGSVQGKDWASIHSFPPWQEMPNPAIVEHWFGKGRVIYSAADIEAVNSREHGGAFIHLVVRLLDKPAAFAAQAHPCVWMSAFDQPDRCRMVVNLLNYQQQLPVLPIRDIPLQLSPPAGQRFKRLSLLPDGPEIPMEISADGRLSACLGRLDMFAMLAAEYEAKP